MDIEIFKNEEFGDIRVVDIEGEPWFVGKDIAESLGYSNSRDALIKHVDIEDKKDGVAIRDAIGREQIPTFINESGLYSLILSSKLESAKRFKRWVTNDVLPSIRKHGMYATEDLLNNPDLLISAVEQLKKEREEKKLLQQRVLELEPKASYYDIVLKCDNVVPISVIAKDYGMSAYQMNEKLNELKVQYKQGNIWLLYQNYAKYGYTKTKTHTYTKKGGVVGCNVLTYWTQKGRLFIYDLLKANGIIPLIEIDGKN